MLDRESELYNSGLLNRGVQARYGAIAITPEGIEVSAINGGLQVEFSSTWKELGKALSSVDARLKVPQRELEEDEDDENVVFAQKVPKRCESPHGRN